jgi:ferredoxin
MKHKMSRKEELQELKTKAIEIKARLDFLEMRIGKVQNGAPPTSQWKAFVDSEKCVGCGVCEETCPFDAISIEECARVDVQRCIGCGRCVQECPKGALSLRPTHFPAQYQTGSWRRANRQSRRMNYAM